MNEKLYNEMKEDFLRWLDEQERIRPFDWLKTDKLKVTVKVSEQS